MLRQLNILFTFLLIGFSCQKIAAQWIQTNGLTGGSMWHVAASDQQIFGMKSKSVFRTMDEGSTWEILNAGLSHDGNSIVTQGNNVFIGNIDGVYRSVNNGENWTKVNDGLNDSTVNVLAINASRIFAGTNNGKVFFSDDNGQQWNEIEGAFPNKKVGSFAFSGQEILVGFHGAGVYKSEDDGNSWALASSNGLQNKVVECLAIINNTIIAGTTNGLWRSLNNGETWTSISGFGGYHVNACVNFKGEFYIGTSSNAAYRSDNGINWTQIPDVVNQSFSSLSFNSSHLYAATTIGVIKTSDFGSTWQHISDNLIATSIPFLIKKWQYLFASALGLYRTDEIGEAWEPTWPIARANSAIFKGSDLYVGFSSFSVYRSKDFGLTWEFVGENMTNGQLADIETHGNKLYAGTNSHGLCRLSEDEKNWILIFWANIIRLKSFGSRLFIGSYQGVYVSDDDGNNFTLSNTGLGNSYVLNFFSSDTTIFACTLQGLFRSTDNGATWEFSSLGVTDSMVYDGIATGGEILIGTYDGHVYHSTDNGDSWEDVSEGLTNSRITSFAFHDNHVFVGTDGTGVWRRPIAEIFSNPLINDTNENISEKIVLNQNYPNPFSSSTIIPLVIPVKSFVSLTIINNNGATIETLVNKELQAGSYSFEWDSSNSAIGTYYCQLKVGEKLFTKKLSLQ